MTIEKKLIEKINTFLKSELLKEEENLQTLVEYGLKVEDIEGVKGISIWLVS